MSLPRILVAGIGNIFCGDDAFGVETVRELQRRPLPTLVVVRDFGVRGHDLALALTEGYTAAILIDAAARGHAPGTVFVLELGAPEQAAAEAFDGGGHSLNPMAVLRLAAQFGSPLPKLILVGCEPAVLETEDGAMELSPPVRAAVPRAAALIESLVADLLQAAAPAAPISASKNRSAPETPTQS